MATQDKQTSTVEQTVSQFIDAGIGLALLPFSLAQQSFASTKEETAAKLASLQARGEKLDAQLKQQLNPGRFWGQVLQTLSPKASRDAKLEELSTKVDTLVELVATLAAKKAAQATANKADTAKAEPAKPATTRRRSAAATKTAAKPRTTTRASTAKTAPKTVKKDAE